MSDVHLDVIPDRTALGGGRCILKLTGIHDLPSDVTYRIDPIDSRIMAPSDPGWPGGDRRPNDIRRASDGFELVLGPDVVDARLLAPGTPVRVAIAAAAIETELRWPDIPRSVARSHTKLLPPPPPRRAIQVAPEAQTEPIALPPPDEPSLAPASDPAVHGDIADFQEMLDSLLQRTNQPPGPDQEENPYGTDETHEAQAPQLGDDADEVDDEDLYVGVSGTVQSGYRMIGYQPPQQSRPSLVAPFLVGLVVAGLLGAGAWIGFQNEINRYVKHVAEARLASQVQPQVQPQAQRQAQRQAQAAAASVAPLPVSLITRPTTTSPRGVTTAGVTSSQALAIADKHLRAEPPDKQEARFWLQTALSRALGSKDMTWGLTQLGTLYAAGATSAPDYARARVMWEIAGVHGDPVALCFLGMLHQKGLGVPPSPKQAHAYFAQAVAAGGCPGRAPDEGTRVAQPATPTPNR